MRGLNKVLLLGHLGKDPLLTYSPDGTAVAKFSLATTEGIKRNGKWENRTTWHEVAAFGKIAELVGSKLQKGSPMFIEGRLSYSKYEKNGAMMRTTNIIVYSLRLLGREVPKVENPEDRPDSETYTSDADLPF